MAKKYKDKEWLQREYVEHRRTTYDIADECSVTAVTIQDWLRRHDIGARDRSECQIEHRKTAPTMNHDEYGYERFFVTNGGNRRVVRVHQLLAIAEGANPKDIFGGYDVHHKNEVPWDNRPENIEVIKHDEHRRYHALRQ